MYIVLMAPVNGLAAVPSRFNTVASFTLPFEYGDPVHLLRSFLYVKVSEVARGEISLQHSLRLHAQLSRITAIV